MTLYVTVSRGLRADLASPVLASSDRTVIEAVLDAIRQLDERDAADGERVPDHVDIPSVARTRSDRAQAVHR